MINKQNHQLALLGLACFACVVVVNAAQTWTNDRTKSDLAHLNQVINPRGEIATHRSRYESNPTPVAAQQISATTPGVDVNAPTVQRTPTAVAATDQHQFQTASFTTSVDRPPKHGGLVLNKNPGATRIINPYSRPAASASKPSPPSRLAIPRDTPIEINSTEVAAEPNQISSQRPNQRGGQPMSPTINWPSRTLLIGAQTITPQAPPANTASNNVRPVDKPSKGAGPLPTQSATPANSQPQRTTTASGKAMASHPTQTPVDTSNDFRPRPQTTSTHQPHDSQATTARNDRVALTSGVSSHFDPANVIEPTPQPSSTKPSVNSQLGPSQDKTPNVLIGADNFVLAAQPKIGDQWKDDRPTTDRRAYQIDTLADDFSPDPINHYLPYDSDQQVNVYQGKTLNANQRPIVELGRPFYQLGQLSPGYSWFGKHNSFTPQFLVYGDTRTVVASNTQNGDNISQVAFEINLDFDLKLTSTERFHMFMSPLDDGQNTRFLLDEDRFVSEHDADIDFGYFEGDLGAIAGGFTDKTLPFDFPFAVGIMPLLFQNGVWMDDAFLGIAVTIPARNSPKLNISNMDTTFFAGYDKINSPAFGADDSAARMYGMASFIEAMNGYFEIDYAFFDDRTANNRSYHNFGFGFSRRFGRLFSNSTRVIANAGQSTDAVANTADGVLLLSENSLITSSPSTLIPYMNFFAGFDRPQSAARAAIAGGVLRNTGILFESDGMTNYPTLDATANDTFGGALGLNILADDFSQQLVVEMAMLGVMGESANRNAPGAQYGVGFRYQLPLTNAVILRADGMYGFLENDQDVRGIRFELRHKY